MTEDKTGISRRRVVGGLSAGLAALATPAAAQNSATGGAPSGNANQAGSTGNGGPGKPIDQGLINPKTEYPPPPFPKQTQDWPGLAKNMTPRPDHGETSYVGHGRLSGRRALITGGDSGMGRAAAIAYAREGADVAINYLSQEEPDAREVVDLIQKAGRKAVPLPGDLRQEAFCSKLVDDAASQLGGLDILVSNAGRQHYVASLSDLTTDEFDWTMKTNIYAMFWLTKAALQHMKPGSAIVCTSSIEAYSPDPGLVDYAMTKAAIRNFVQSMAKQLAPKGIRVNGVAPGPIWTALQVTGGQPPDKIPQFGADTPLGRAGQPTELAGIYVLLASYEDSYSSGQIYGATAGRGGP